MGVHNAKPGARLLCLSVFWVACVCGGGGEGGAGGRGFAFELKYVHACVLW